MPAMQWYKVRLCRIKAQESANTSGSVLWTQIMQNSMADISTITARILILFAEDHWT